MDTAVYVLLGLLAALAIGFAVYWYRELTKNGQCKTPKWYELLIGFITDFLDFLGIGSFAVTTTIFRTFRVVPDHLIPGTLNVGHTLPTVAQALIAIAIIKVDIWTLWLLILASVVGAWFGARLVSRLPKRGVQAGMGIALFIAAIFLTAGLSDAMPKGGDALGLQGGKLWLAIALNVFFGAMMTIGVGAYAPIMVMISLMGMNPDAAFPIMMGSCAFLMPAASYQFIKNQRYDSRAALGLAIGGIPGVLIAAWIIKSLPLVALKKLVLVVVIYTATIMLYSAFRAPEKKSDTTDTPAQP